MQFAAVLGKTFEFAELLAAIEPDGSSPGGEGRLLDALDEALDAQLIRSGGGESFAFTHDKIREVLYEELNPVRRRRLHQRLAESLERLPGGQVQNLAYHYLQGGDLHKGLHYALLAAQQSQKLFAYDDALRYYQYAFECAEALNIPEQLAEIRRANGDIYFLQGTFYTAVNSFQQALELEKSPEQRAVLKSRIGIAYAQVGDKRGLGFLQEAQGELHPASQVDDLAYNLTAMGATSIIMPNIPGRSPTLNAPAPWRSRSTSPSLCPISTHIWLALTSTCCAWTRALPGRGSVSPWVSG